MMAFTEALWLGVAVHLWQTSLVLVALFALGALMRTAPARLAGMLWWAGLVKLMLPLSLFPPLFGGTTRTLLNDWVAPDSAAGASLQVAVLVFDPTSWNAQSPRTSAVAPNYFFLGLTVLWAFVAIAIVARFIRGAIRALARSPLGQADVPESIRARCDEAIQGTEIPARRLVICADRAMPAAAGWFVPRIFVPQSVVAALPVDELRGVLLHEDAHRRRRDPLLSALRSLMFALFHFYPLLWPLLGRLRRNAELACDEAVLRSGVAPEVYARALARTMLLGLCPAHAPAAADPLRPSLLHERFERINQSERYKTMNRHRLTLVAGAVLVAASFFMPEAGLAELKLNESAPPQAGTRARDLNPSMPTVRLRAKKFQLPQVQTNRGELGLPLGCFVSVRLMVAVNATGEVKSISTNPSVVLAGVPGCKNRDGSKLTVDDFKIQDAVAQSLFKGAPFEAPASKELGPDGYAIGWFEIRWQIPAEGPLQWTKTTIIQGLEHDIALVLLPPLPELEGAAPPKLIAESRVDPDYPKSELKSGISGDVVLQALVGIDGAVTDVVVVQGIDGHPAFSESAVAAVKLWRFTPIVIDDMPARFAYTVTVRFQPE